MLVFVEDTGVVFLDGASGSSKAAATVTSLSVIPEGTVSAAPLPPVSRSESFQ